MNPIFKKLPVEAFNCIFLLVFSLLVDLFLNGSITVSSFVLFLIYAVVYSFSRPFFLVSISISALLSFFYIPIMLQYGPPTFSMTVAAFYSNEAEALDFISYFPILYYLFSFLFLLFSIFVARKRYLSFSGGFRIIIIGVILLYTIIPPSYNLMKQGRKKTAISSYVYYGPIKFVFDNIRNYVLVKNEDAKIKDILSKEDSWNVDSVDNKKDLQIVVIGESARRDFMNAYGFGIKNTPFMSSSNGILFEKFISASSSTVPSLERMLCQNNYSTFSIENNIITLAKKSGFYTHWFSNQGSIGLYDTPLASIGRLADDDKFIHFGDSKSKKSSDFDLLPWIKEAVAENDKGNQLIVVHLYGSHFLFCDRTDGKYDEFYKTNDFSCYVQSIKNTDKLLQEIYKLAVASQKSFNMVYLSDHGLSFNKKNELVHGGNYKQNYDVPLFVWSDDAVSLDTIAAARSGMDFLTFFAELVGIKEKCLVRSHKFISNEIAPKILILNSDDQICSYDELESDYIENTK